jgi:hypothetical protein
MNPRKKAGKLDLVDLWYDVIAGKSLSKEAVTFAKQHTRSNDLQQIVISEAILFIAKIENGKEPSQRLLEICLMPEIYNNPQAAAILLSALEHFPVSKLRGKEAVRNFIYLSAQNPFLPPRLNAMRVLSRLAKMGDQKAFQLLRKSKRDSHMYVREAARTGLKLAEPS